MSTNKSKAHEIRILAAVLFLLFTRIIYCFMEHGAKIVWYCFVAETILFLLIYCLGLFCAPPLLSSACLLFGCIGVGSLYGLAEGFREFDYLLPMSYFPALLFFLNQCITVQDKENNQKDSIIWSLLQYVYPWLVVGLIVLTIYNKSFHFSLDFVYGLVICACICFVYGLIARTTSMKKQKKSQKDEKQAIKRMQAAFLFAIVSIPLTGLYLLVAENVVLIHTVPMLWLVNIVLLNENGHPLVCAFSERMKRKQYEFLEDKNIPEA